MQHFLFTIIQYFLAFLAVFALDSSFFLVSFFLILMKKRKYVMYCTMYII